MQRVHTLTVVALVALVAVLAAAQAFQWAPFEFPLGDQGSTVEVASADGVVALDIDIVDRNESFDVTAVMRFEQEGVAAGDLGSAMFAGGDAFEARLVAVR